MLYIRKDLTGIIFCIFIICLRISLNFVSHEKNVQKIVILGTNDLHGALKNTENQSLDEPGGLANLMAYIHILKKEYRKNFIWIDAGDGFHGSLESNRQHGAPMLRFFNLAKPHVMVLGSHEFDFGIQSLHKNILAAKFPILAANLQPKTIDAQLFLQNIQPSIMLHTERLQIGIIGTITKDTPYFSTPTGDLLHHFQFDDPYTYILRESQKLKAQGANIIILGAHLSIDCNPTPFLENSIQRWSELQHCENHSELKALLKSLPEGTIDAVIAGHSHKIVHHQIENIPVIQAAAYGKYFNILTIAYDVKMQKILPQESFIEGPVPISSQQKKDQMPVTFHGKKIVPDQNIQTLINDIMQHEHFIRSEKLAVLQGALPHNPTQESLMGNLVADAIRFVAAADCALMHAGGIRSGLLEGEITYGKLFQVLPFDNFVSVLEVTGEQLQDLLRISQKFNAQHGFASVSGLRLDIIGNAQQKMTNKSRYVAAWLLSGQKVSSKNVYRLALPDFLIKSADGFSDVIQKLDHSKIRHTNLLIRDVVANYLRQMKSLDLSNTQSLKFRFRFSPIKPKDQKFFSQKKF